MLRVYRLSVEKCKTISEVSFPNLKEVDLCNVSLIYMDQKCQTMEFTILPMQNGEISLK